MADTSNRILSIAALVSSLAAIGLFAYQSARMRAQSEFADRIDELEREVALLQGNIYPVQAGLGEALEAGGGERLADAALEVRGSVEDDLEEMRWAMTARGFMPATQAHIERSERTIFDPTQNAEEKLLAARVLRRSERLGDAEVREMIAVFHSTGNHHVQASILRVLDGLTTPELAPTLLKASAESPSSRVRREAVDAMSGFLPDRELEDWLGYVIKHDGDKRVRDEARRLLEMHGGNGDG